MRGNFCALISDHLGMECDRYRHALSARIDGEDPGIEPDLLGRHLAGCTACRNWEADASRLARAVRVSSAEAIPDLTPAILAAIGNERAPAWPGVAVLRVALGIVAMFTIFLNGQDLFFSDELGHTTRELASFELALGVGFASAAWRPARAFGMVPIVGAFMVLLAATTVANGEPLEVIVTESVHTLQVAGAVLIGFVSRAAGPVPGRHTRLRLLRA